MEKLTLSFFILTTLKKFLPLFLRIILYTSRYWRGSTTAVHNTGGAIQCCERKTASRRSCPEARQELLEFESPAVQPGKKDPKQFLKHDWKKITAVVCVAAVAAAVLLPKTSKKDVQASTQYVEAALERRDITNTFSGSGTISAANTYTVKSLVKGTVLTADFEVGDTIEKGTVLYTIDSSDVATSVEKAQLALEQAQRSYDDAADAQYIRSVIGGTVASIKVKAGDYVTAGQEIATVRDDSSLLLTLEFLAADASNLPWVRLHRSCSTVPLRPFPARCRLWPVPIPSAAAICWCAP